MMTGTNEDASWPMAGVDRRRHPRKYISGVGHLLAAGLPPMEVHTQDISVGGVGVIAPRSLPYEALCKVRFALPRESYGMEFVIAPARVAHCVLSGREYGFVLGLEFHNLPEDVAAVINRYMSVKGAILSFGNG